MTHLLSLDPAIYSKIKSGDVNFLLTKANPFYKEGDKLIVQEVDEETQSPSGDEIDLRITQLINDEPKGLKQGYCIISFKEPTNL